jgi:Fe-Mn family superoxide dismutase
MTTHGMDRREALSALGGFGAAALAASAIAQPAGTPMIGTGTPAKPDLTPQQLGWDPDKGEYILPPLPYDKAALEPHVDAKTMEIHHTKHHQAYVDGLNKALKQLAAIREGGDASLVKHWSREFSFHGAGHFNHVWFWHSMAPAGKGGGGTPAGKLAEALARDFGSFEKFVAHFKAAAVQVEGGGWAFLALEPIARRLVVVQVEKQQDMMPPGLRPILGLDVWEHAYYLTYQNRRSAYVDAWFNVVNWAFAERQYHQASA